MRSRGVLEAQRRGREEWLKLRQQQLQGSGADPDEARARAREDWLKLREQQGGISADEAAQQEPGRNRQRDEPAKDRDSGVDTDPDT
ncbi:MAG TPA: hypothetical protein VGH61_13380 [Steroidobacteraceae bacterium]